MKKVAFCLKGMIKKNNKGEYLDIQRCKKSIDKYIIEQNPNYQFDFFCQCWNEDLEDTLKSLYKPKMLLCEDNNKFSNEISEKYNSSSNQFFNQVSHSLAIKKCIEIKENYEIQNNLQYDIVILYRYDLLLWKEILLDKYILNKDNIYVNAHINCNGDFHFILNNNNSKLFKNLYYSPKNGNVPKEHYWIKNYIINYLKKNLIMDDIVPGRYQELINKL